MVHNNPLYLEIAGNLVPVVKTDDQLNIVFRAFVENRLSFTVRICDTSVEPSAQLSLMHEPRETPGQSAVCTLIITLPDFIPLDENDNLETTGFLSRLSG